MIRKRIKDLEKNIISVLYFGLLRLRKNGGNRYHLSGVIMKNYIQPVMDVEKNFSSKHDVYNFLDSLSKTKFNGNTKFIMILSKEEEHIDEECN